MIPKEFVENLLIASRCFYISLVAKVLLEVAEENEKTDN